MHLRLLAATYSKLEVSFGKYRYDYLDSKSMFLDVKVLFGNLSLVSAPAFSSRTKALRMRVIHPVTQSTLLKLATST